MRFCYNRKGRVMMSSEFRNSLKGSEPPVGLSPLLLALWWDAKGDWKRAHEIAQEIDSQNGAWVHAYLHRKEGDASNAAYWYRQAGKPVCRSASEDEWIDLSDHLLTSEFHS